MTLVNGYGIVAVFAFPFLKCDARSASDPVPVHPLLLGGFPEADRAGILSASLDRAGSSRPVWQGGTFVRIFAILE